MKNKEKKKKNANKNESPEIAKIDLIDYSDEVKRLNRITGQIEGISKMLEEKRKLNDILVQCKAVRSAVKSIESRLLNLHLEQVLDEVAKLDKRKSREQQLAELKEFFKHGA